VGGGSRGGLLPPTDFPCADDDAGQSGRVSPSVSSAPIATESDEEQWGEAWGASPHIAVAGVPSRASGPKAPLGRDSPTVSGGLGSTSTDMDEGNAGF
jgi:hypothetical protein